MEKQQPIRFGIGRKLLLYFLVLALLPMTVGGAFSFFVSRSQLEEKTKAHLSDLARDCAKKITYYVSSRYQDIKLLSLAGDLRGNDSALKQTFIEEALHAYPFYVAIAVLNPDGTIVASTRKDLIGASRANEPWFQKAAQSKPGEVISLDAYRSRNAEQKLVIGFSTPITGESRGDVIGVLTTTVGMDHIVDRVRVLDKRAVGENHAYLLNRRGEIIAGPHEKEFLTPHRLIAFPVIRDLLSGRTGISEYENDKGEKVISAYYALKGDTDFDGWGWGIVVSEPISKAYKGAYIIRNSTIIMGLAIALLVTVLAVFISRRFSRPITDLSKSALQISRGDLKPMHIAYGSTDEIGHLVAAFNKMTADLYETTVSRDALAQEVTHRKLAEERIRHLNLVLRSIRKVNHIITHERDRDRLLKGVCYNLIQNRGYYHAWIALLDESGGLVTATEAGLGKKFRPLVDQMEHGKLPDCALRALSQSEVLVTGDPLPACSDCPLLAAHNNGGALTTRLECGDKVYGLLSASIPKNFVSDEEEQDLFREAASDIALALLGLELEDKRKRAEDAVRKSEEKFRNILHGSPIPTFVIDNNHRVTYWNRAIEEYSGIASTDIIGTDQQWKAFYDKARPCMADLLVDGRIDEIARWYPMNHRASDLIEGAHEAADFFERIGHGGKWLYFTAAPLKDFEGNLTGAVETLQDITYTKKAEEQIRVLTGQVIEIEEKERQYLSREMHDNIGQLLFALKMGLSRANKKIPKQFSAIKDQLTELTYIANRTIVEIRELSHALHPPLIEDLGIVSALQQLCEDFKSYSEIEVKCDFEDMGEHLQPITIITIYRLFQEGLHNVLKHSRATEVYLSLKSLNNTMIAVIQDNGIGFVLDSVLAPQQRKSLGLLSMKERVLLVKGELEIIAAPGQGTKITAWLPKE